MPGKWIDKMVKCPFYRKTDPNRIVCEGLREGTTIALNFESSVEKREYMRERCQGIEGCRYCPIHSLLDRINCGE